MHKKLFTQTWVPCALLSCGVILGTSAAQAQNSAAGPKIGSICNTTAPISMSAARDGEGKLTKIPAKKAVEVMEMKNGWYKIKFNKDVGFIKAAILNKNCKDAGRQIVKKELQKEEKLKGQREKVDMSQSEAAQTITKKGADVRTTPAKISMDELRGTSDKQSQQKEDNEEINRLIDAAISDCNELLELADPDDVDSADTIQDCADRYWEKRKQLFMCSEDLSNSAEKQEQCRVDMGQAQQKTLDLYQQILDEYKNILPTYDEVLYNLGLYRVEIETNEQARKASKNFKDIIQYYPSSSHYYDAWYQLGEFYFNVDNSAKMALGSYQKAAEKTDTFIYPFSIYKQGWCYINTGDWKEARERFEHTASVACKPNPKFNWSNLCKDTLKDYVRAYSNVGTAKDAMANFKQIGGQENYRSMLEQLGQMLIDQGKHADVTTVFHDLIKDDPNDLRNPIFYAYLVDSASAQGNKDKVVEAIKDLAGAITKARKIAKDMEKKQQNNTAFEESEADKKQHEANLKKIQKSLNEALDSSENTIRKVAFDYQKEGSSTSNLKVMHYAQDVFKAYLEIFPDSKYLFQISFTYAELLYDIAEKTEDDKEYANLMSEAADFYIKTVKINPHPEKANEKAVVEAAAGNAVRALSGVIEYQEKLKPAKVSGTKEAPIPPLYQKLIDACLTYIEYRPDGDDIVGIRYKMARIYYLFNHFDKAAPAFHDIVTNHPEDQAACYAAKQTIDIYNGESDFAKLQQLTREYINNQRLSCTDEDRAQFAVIEIKATFMLAQALEQKEQYLEGAAAYMDFYKRYPDSEYAPLAVNNAALCYDKGSKLEEAIETRLFLITKLAKHPYADVDLIKDTTYDIALNYERIADFATAADYLEKFVNSYPKDKRSNQSIFNAAIYREVLKQYGKAEKNRWTYIEKYKKDLKEGAEVYFSICEAKEKACNEYDEKIKEADKKDRSDMRKISLEKWEKAADCYSNYLKVKSYEKQPGALDRQCYGLFRHAEIMRLKVKNTQQARKEYDLILQNWAKSWEKQAKEEHADRCAAAVAERRFKDLGWIMANYKKMTLSELNPAKKELFQKSLKAKTAKRDALKASYEKVAAIGVAEWSLAALYQIGELNYDLIDKIKKAPIPKYMFGEEVDDDMRDVIQEQLDEMAEPVNAVAIEAYQLAADKASELGVYNSWSMKALDRLHEYGEFPLIVEKELPPIPGEISLRRLTFVTDPKKPEPEEFKEVKLKEPEPEPIPAAVTECVPAEGVECPTVTPESVPAGDAAAAPAADDTAANGAN